MPGMRRVHARRLKPMPGGTAAQPTPARKFQPASDRIAAMTPGSSGVSATASMAGGGVQASAAAALNSAPGVTLYLADGNLRPLDAIEADVIRLAIGHYRGRMSEVARRLGIGRSTLYRKLAELGIDSAA